MSYFISLGEAVDFIEGFVSNYEEVAINEALGGHISPSGIEGKSKSNFASTIYTGNMAWFCYNTVSLENYPKLFLAFEESNDYAKGQVLSRPDNNILRCPTKDSVFTYPTGTSIEDMLRNGAPYRGNPLDQQVGINDVVSLKNQYLSHPILGGLNKHPYGFFSDSVNNEVQRFILQDGLVSIRYYFGYGRNAEYKESRIRIVLFGVGEDGKNLVPNDLNAKLVDGPHILQKSWPPNT